MTPTPDRSLTADLAKADEMRGRSDEAAVGRAALADDDRATAADAATQAVNAPERTTLEHQ